MANQKLAGLHILVLEDEFLIAMDVEQICLDDGASLVTVCKSIGESSAASGFDAAIIDLMLGGESTLPFARSLAERDMPFIFASGYSDRPDVRSEFPNVRIVAKPYSGDDLISALAAAISAAKRSS